MPSKTRKPKVILKETKNGRWFYESKSSNGNKLDRSTEGDSYPDISAVKRAFQQHTQARLKILGLKPFAFSADWWVYQESHGHVVVEYYKGRK